MSLTTSLTDTTSVPVMPDTRADGPPLPTHEQYDDLVRRGGSYDHPPVITVEVMKAWTKATRPYSTAYIYASHVGVLSEKYGILRSLVTRRDKHVWIWDDMPGGRNLLVPFTFLFSPYRFEEWYKQKFNESPWEYGDWPWNIRPLLKEWKRFLKNEFGIVGYGKNDR